uniref:Uncharacterized protein n=1 Tax=Trypanosoma congolense (strain IL3000) TaxID=1068625 RepID=G0UUB8_TRYCI|nr:hypothetical protein, unlikely [Trypanosoma congolense IL3000]
MSASVDVFAPSQGIVTCFFCECANARLIMKMRPENNTQRVQHQTFCFLFKQAVNSGLTSCVPPNYMYLRYTNILYIPCSQTPFRQAYPSRNGCNSAPLHTTAWVVENSTVTSCQSFVLRLC